MDSFISIKTTIPGPKSREIAKRKEKYVGKSFGDALSPCYIASGIGALVTDVDGNRFIDLTGGWGCLAVGHSHERIVKVIKEQAEKYIHTDFTVVPYEPFLM